MHNTLGEQRHDGTQRCRLGVRIGVFLREYRAGEIDACESGAAQRRAAQARAVEAGALEPRAVELRNGDAGVVMEKCKAGVAGEATGRAPQRGRG